MEGSLTSHGQERRERKTVFPSLLPARPLFVCVVGKHGTETGSSLSKIRLLEPSGGGGDPVELAVANVHRLARGSTIGTTAGYRQVFRRRSVKAAPRPKKAARDAAPFGPLSCARNEKPRGSPPTPSFPRFERGGRSRPLRVILLRELGEGERGYFLEGEEERGPLSTQTPPAAPSFKDIQQRRPSSPFAAQWR